MPSSTSVRLLASIILLATLPAVAHAKDAPRAHGACFYSRDIDGFRSVDDKTVYLRAGVRNTYELKLFASCPDVDWNERIGLRTFGSSWICEGNGLNVEVISHSPIGPRRCNVTSIRKLTPADVAALPKHARP